MSSPTVHDVEPLTRVLRSAAQIIERNGWHQGDYYDRDQLDGDRSPADCRVCALGALNLAAGNGEPDALSIAGSDAAHALAYYLAIDDIADWNDRTAIEASNVTDALRNAADELEREWT